jgi:hypothetical protein
MWLQGIERRNGVLTAKLVKGNGDVEWMNVEATWEGDMPVSSTSRMSGTTCFSRWKLVDATEYLSEMAIEADPADNRHQIFEVDHNGLRLVLPAILVLKALFKPSATVFEYLFRPSGMDMLLAPKHANGSMSVVLLPQRIRQHVPVGDTTFERFQWLYCFPSAQASFYSVYGYATSGIVGLKLPKAEVDIWLKGRLIGNRFFASNLNIARCAPLEAPFDWAGWQPKGFRLKCPPTSEQLNPILVDSELIEGPAGWELSDEEWALVEHLFPSGPRLRSGKPARDFVGAILTKLGTGAGWACVNSRFGTTSAVSSFYQNSRKSGRWDKVITILMEMRKKSMTLAPAA